MPINQFLLNIVCPYVKKWFKRLYCIYKPIFKKKLYRIAEARLLHSRDSILYIGGSYCILNLGGSVYIAEAHGAQGFPPSLGLLINLTLRQTNNNDCEQYDTKLKTDSKRHDICKQEKRLWLRSFEKKFLVYFQPVPFVSS